MNGDTTIRLLLAGIFVCLGLLVIQGLRSGGGAGGAGRYQVTDTRAGTPLLVRTDTVTGKVWRFELRGGRSWIALAEGDEAPEAAGERSQAPKPPAASAATARPDPPDAGRGAPDRAFASVPDPTPETPPAEDYDDLARAASGTSLPPDIRLWAVRQLGRHADPRSVDVLLGVLGDAEPRLVGAAVESLARKDDARVPAALEALRDHADPAVQAALQAQGGAE